MEHEGGEHAAHAHDSGDDHDTHESFADEGHDSHGFGSTVVRTVRLAQ